MMSTLCNAISRQHVKSVIKISELSPMQTVQNIRHQHRCSYEDFTHWRTSHFQISFSSSLSILLSIQNAIHFRNKVTVGQVKVIWSKFWVIFRQKIRKKSRLGSVRGIFLYLKSAQIKLVLNYSVCSIFRLLNFSEPLAD